MNRQRRFLLVGSSVAHSLSPVMHTAALAASGLEGTYEVLDTDERGLEKAVEEMRAGLLDGINVTMPLKGAARRAADVLTPQAQGAGSVNTLRAGGGAVEGHSTDVVAISRIARSQCEHATTVLVLGGGGAARAALHGLSELSAYVSARRQEQADALASRFEGTRTLPWGSGVAGAIVINATPIGMHGEALPSAPLSLASCVVDLAYGGDETPAVAWARDSGVPIVDGVQFLSEAASASFSWWTGVHVDSTVMLQAARNTKDAQ